MFSLFSLFSLRVFVLPLGLTTAHAHQDGGTGGGGVVLWTAGQTAGRDFRSNRGNGRWREKKCTCILLPPVPTQRWQRQSLRCTAAAAARATPSSTGTPLGRAVASCPSRLVLCCSKGNRTHIPSPLRPAICVATAPGCCIRRRVGMSFCVLSCSFCRLSERARRPVRVFSFSALVFCSVCCLPHDAEDV